MSWDVTILRGVDAGDDGHPIPLEEWQAHVAADPDMHMDENRSGDAYWTAWPDEDGRGDGDPLPLHYFEGMISVSSPDSATFRKMAHIACALGAKLQGEEGEVYNGDGEMVDLGPGPVVTCTKDAQELMARPIIRGEEKTKPWWKVW